MTNLAFSTGEVGRGMIEGIQKGGLSINDNTIIC